MEIKLTADKKLMEVLEQIAAALTGALTSAAQPTGSPQTPAPAQAEKTAVRETQPAAAAPAAADADQEPPFPLETPSRDEIQRLAIARIQAGKRDAVKALVVKYGAARVGEVAEDRLAYFKAELEAL